MDGKKLHSRAPLLTLRVEQTINGTLVAAVIPQTRINVQDDLGALYYVVAVILIYGCSIVMMIASYIRKNKDDRRLKRYLKEMAFVRKRELHMSLMWAATKAAALRRNAITPGQAGEPSAGPPALEPDRPETETSSPLESTVWVKQSSETLNTGEISEEEAPLVTAPLPPDALPSSKVMTSTVKLASGLGRRSLDCQKGFRPSIEVPSRRSSIPLSVAQMNLPKLLLTVPKVEEQGPKVNAPSPAEGPTQRPDRKQSCPSLQVISIF